MYYNENSTFSLINHIGGVMVDMLAVSAKDFGFEPWSVQTKDYKIKIGFCCFPAKHTALRRKSKNWLAVNPTGCYFSELTQ